MFHIDLRNGNFSCYTICRKGLHGYMYMNGKEVVSQLTLGRPSSESFIIMSPIHLVSLLFLIHTFTKAGKHTRGAWTGTRRIRWRILMVSNQLWLYIFQHFTTSASFPSFSVLRKGGGRNVRKEERKKETWIESRYSFCMVPLLHKPCVFLHPSRRAGANECKHT